MRNYCICKRLWNILHNTFLHKACEIGYNCPQALMPREVVCERNQSFAQRTDLGWNIVSYVNHSEHDCDVMGVSHHIIAKEEIP